jgi:hypothetical protein
VFRADLFYRLNLLSIAAQVDACLEIVNLATRAGTMVGDDRGSWIPGVG